MTGLWPLPPGRPVTCRRRALGDQRSTHYRFCRDEVRQQRSALRAVPGGEDDLGHHIGAHAELVRYFGWPESLLVVDERELFLPLGPRAAGWRRGRSRWGGCGWAR